VWLGRTRAGSSRTRSASDLNALSLRPSHTGRAESTAQTRGLGLMLADRGVGDRQGQSLAAPLRERSPTRFVRSSRWQDLRAQWRHHFAQAARARSRAATRTFPARPASHRPKLLGQAQTAGLGLCPRPRRGSERRGHPASLADDSLRRRGRQPRFGTDLEECRLELCQTSERSVAVVARAASLTVLVAPSRQVEPRPGGGAIPGTDRSIRRAPVPPGVGLMTRPGSAGPAAR